MNQNLAQVKDDYESLFCCTKEADDSLLTRLYKVLTFEINYRQGLLTQEEKDDEAITESYKTLQALSSAALILLTHDEYAQLVKEAPALSEWLAQAKESRKQRRRRNKQRYDKRQQKGKRR